MNDLRAKLCQAYTKGDGSRSAERPPGRARGFPSRLTPELREALQLRLAQLPDATLLELQGWLEDNHEVSISVQRLSAVLLEMGCRRKKRVAWREQIASVAPEDLVFLDESGVTTDMSRRYGRAQRGQRITEGTPGGRWQTVTMLGAICPEGWTATMTVPGPTDSEVFLAYLNVVLCPALRPGQVVVMDNLAAHKVAGVAAAIAADIAAVGARVLYLPPYSPDFNPIEACWFVVKQCLRKLKVSSLSALDEAIPIALAHVSKQTIANGLRHCDYALR